MHRTNARTTSNLDPIVVVTRAILTVGLTVGLAAGLPYTTAASTAEPAPATSAGGTR